MAGPATTPTPAKWSRKTLTTEHTAAMSSEPDNREIVRRAFEDWSSGIGYISALFADDLTWEIVGGPLLLPASKLPDSGRDLNEVPAVPALPAGDRERQGIALSQLRDPGGRQPEHLGGLSRGEPHVVVVGQALPAFPAPRLGGGPHVAGPLRGQSARGPPRPTSGARGARGAQLAARVTLRDRAQDPVRAATEQLRGRRHRAPLSPLPGPLAGRGLLDPPPTADEHAPEGGRAHELAHPALAEPEQVAPVGQGHVP
jgi:hypothetical protein